MTEKLIQIRHNYKLWETKTVKSALVHAANLLNVAQSELTCELSDPFLYPFAGRCVDVYVGEWNIDTVVSLAVPSGLVAKWLNHNGINQLR